MLKRFPKIGWNKIRWLGIFYIVCIFLIVSLQVKIDQIRSTTRRVEELRFLPSSDALRIVSLGYREFVADLLWLKAIQFVGGKDQTGKGYDWLYHVLDVVTDLDPKFFEAYQVGAMALSVLGSHPDQSVLLLQKGAAQIPDRWELYFYLGFNYFYFLDDFKNAAIHMEKATTLSGSPPYLVNLTAKLLAESHSPATSLTFALGAYASINDPHIRERLKKTINVLKVKVDLEGLNAAADKFLSKYPEERPSLDRFLGVGLISMKPVEPYGGEYYWDPARKKFETTSRIDELKIYINEAGRSR